MAALRFVWKKKGTTKEDGGGGGAEGKKNATSPSRQSGQLSCLQGLQAVDLLSRACEQDVVLSLETMAVENLGAVVCHHMC